jgi:hypothetical protein
MVFGGGLQAEDAVTMWVFNAWAAAIVKQKIVIMSHSFYFCTKEIFHT